VEQVEIPGTNEYSGTQIPRALVDPYTQIPAAQELILIQQFLLWSQNPDQQIRICFQNKC